MLAIAMTQEDDVEHQSHSPPDISLEMADFLEMAERMVVFSSLFRGLLPAS